MATRTAVTDVQRVEIGAEPAALAVRPSRRAPIVAALALALVAVGAGITSARPSAAELEQAHWQSVVAQYSEMHQAAARAAAAEDTHWQQVVDYHEARWMEG